jgi:hypothetical protein
LRAVDGHDQTMGRQGGVKRDAGQTAIESFSRPVDRYDDIDAALRLLLFEVNSHL